MARANILVIEDDEDIQELLTFNLSKEGYTVACAGSSERGLAMAKESPPDLVVLDVMLPGMDGLETLKRLKVHRTTTTVPVIMVTARGEDTDIVAALELGADDYVTKPFSPKVLVARVRAALRRRSGADQDLTTTPHLSACGIVLDSARHEATWNGQKADLSATEFSLLEFFLRNPGLVFTRSRIIDAVKGPDYPVTDRSVDVQVLSLRRKLGACGDAIETVRGVGYRMRDDD